MSNGMDAFRKKATGKFFAFGKIPGTTCAGTVTEISDQKQATKYQRDPKAKRELDFWPSGDPVMEVWISVQTQDRDPQDPEDTGLRTLVVTVNQKAGGQLAAIMDACEAATGETFPAVGGFLALTFTGFDPASENPDNPRKLYSGMYQPPAPGGGAFAPQAAQQPAAAPAAQYNQWNPAPAPQAAPAAYQPPVAAPAAAAAPAWAAPAAAPAPAAYQPPAQVDQSTGEIAPQAWANPAAPAPTPQPAYTPPPAAPVAGGWDAQAVIACLHQGMDDATIAATTGAPAAAVAAIRANGPQ